MNRTRQAKSGRSKSGQVMALFVVMIPVLLCFTGLAVDLGRAYITKTTLSKAVDAAALAAMNNLHLGQSEALTIAQSAFNANFGSNPPAVSIVYSTDSNNNMLVNVSAATSINTVFIGLLSGVKVMNVSSSAQATRNPLVMSLVLDQSYSMTKNGGEQALPPAVNGFIAHFDDSEDHVADINFATLASVPVAMAQPFISKIESSVNSMQFGSGPDGQRTNSYAGMEDAQTQISGAPISGPNVRKVVVFFTDGWSNILQDNLTCATGRGAQSTPMLYCGCDPGDYSLNLCSGVFFFNPTTGNQEACSAFGASGSSPTSGTVNSTAAFPSQQTGGSVTLYPATVTGMTNCATEADYRTVQLANAMRQQNIVVYSIGLGSGINKPFLQQVANDPASPTYDSTQPVGEAVFAPNSTQLQTVFNVIAAKILLRLTQ